MIEKQENQTFDLTTLIEVTLPSDPNDPTKANFLIVKETLTRIGVASHVKHVLWQSCHILHKRNKYYLVHFKELFGLDGKEYTFTEDDMARRNTIANMLAEWKLVNLVDPLKSKEPTVERDKIKVVSTKQKSQWTLASKHPLGSNKENK